MPKIDLGKVVGEDAKITIGTTTTLDAGNDATVENVGTKSDAVLNFGIPKGYTPIKGTDYWTENDIDEIHDYVDEQISAIDLTPYSEKTETGHSIELSINAQTYVMTATLKNVSGDVLNTQTIDLPLETMVVSGSYDSATKEVVLTLQSGSTIRFSVSDLVSGLVSESDLEVTLADYVSRETFDSIIGDLDDLSTEDKTTIVNAINEVASSSGSYVAGEGINISNNEISSTMPIYQIPPTSEGDPFVIQNKPAGIYIFRKNSYNTNTIHFKAYDDTKIEYFYAGAGFLVLTDTSLDKSKSQWKTVGYFYGSVYDDHFTNSNYYVTGMKEINIWQENGGFNTYDLIMNSNAGYKFMNPEARAKITQKHTYNVLPESTVVPTNDNQFTNKKYVDDSIAASSSNVPTITITTSQVVSQDPIKISLTEEQQTIIEDANIPTVIIDASALGVNPVYCQKSTQNSEIVSLLATSVDGTNDSVSGFTYLAGVYDIESQTLTVVITPPIGVTPTADNHLANKKYVDDAVASSGGGGKVYTFTADSYSNPLSGSDKLIYFTKWYNDYLNGINSTMVLRVKGSNGFSTNYYTLTSVINDGRQLVFTNSYGNSQQITYLFAVTLIVSSSNTVTKINFNGDTYLPRIFIQPNITSQNANEQYSFKVLSTTNTAEYTPTSNYHPSTKKYVDDSIAAAITTTLGGSY